MPAISALPTTTTLGLSDILPIVQSSTTKQISISQIRNYVSVKDYGAVGDGSTDDTTAIQNAVNTGLTVYFPTPSSYYKITAAITPTSNQILFGDGVDSQIRQVTANANVIHATSKTGVVVTNLKCYAVGSWTGYNNGAGVLLQSCEKCFVSNITVENHRGGGVVLYATNDSKVFGCTFLNSPVVAGELDSTMAWDIGVVYSSSRNQVIGNSCVSGQGTGILVQSVASSDTCDDNVVAYNNVKDTKTYGICSYRNDDSIPITQSVARTIILGNVVNGVSGNVVNSVSGTYTYGAGIYAQGSEDVVISNNNVRNTHNAGLAYATQLAPGGIGITNLMRCTVTGNIVDTCGMYGIDIGEANDLGVTVGFTIVADNSVTNTAQNGISIRQRGRIKITNNAVDTTATSGIRINNSSAESHITINGNSVRNTTGTANIEVNYANGVLVSGNNCDTCNTHGIAVSNSAGASVLNNLIKNHGSRGIQIASTSSLASVLGNNIIGTGTSVEGIRLDALTTVDGSNRISGCTTRWAGTYAVLRGTQSGTLAANVGAGEDDLKSYVLPANSMVDTNDTVRVRAWGTTTNNANAKTVRMYFGSQLVLTSALTTGIAGVWVVEATFLRTGSNAQRCEATLLQGGTVIVDPESVAATQTETADITIKFTGEGVANNDIFQLGMVVSFLKG